MDRTDAAELLAALEAVRGFLEQTVENNRVLVEALKDGRCPPEAQLAELLERVAVDERELERFRGRLAQLTALQRPH